MTKKHELYHKEQEQIRDKVQTLLHLQGETQILLSDMDANTQLHDGIMNLLPTIRDYFAMSKLKCVSYPQTCLRPWLSLAKHLLSTRYEISSKLAKVKSKHTMKYTFSPKST